MKCVLACLMSRHVQDAFMNLDYALRLLPAVLLLPLCSCSTKYSTIKNEKTAWRLDRASAQQVVNAAVQSNLSAERIEGRATGESLTATGYIRFTVDTHTFTASAVPVRTAAGVGYGFEVRAWGTMLLSGAAKGRAIYSDIKHRADLLAPRFTTSAASP
jgi:hypothetical protein